MDDAHKPEAVGHFTYCFPIDKTSLMQGDVISRTDDINLVLKEVHPHFYHHPKNRYFMVITQSCDLVLGRRGDACKAPYITIAPVRPLSEVVRRQVDDLSEAGFQSDLPILSSRAKSNLSMFLSRLLNNNEPGYFFLEAASTPLEEDCCAMLNLSIAIKAPLHYEKCLAAKIVQLDQAFQAKLGWLVGQMYSRVGTTDWESSRLSAKSSALLKDAAIWVPDDKMQSVRQALLAGDTDGVVTERKVSEVIKGLPSKKEAIFTRVATVLDGALAGEDKADVYQRIMKRLRNDAVLSSLMPK